MTTRQPELLVLRCNAAPDRCRWRPPGDLTMELVAAHFDMEEGHDPEDLKMEMVAWCWRCDVEMYLFRTQDLGQGSERLHYHCELCRQARWVDQHHPQEGQ